MADTTQARRNLRLADFEGRWCLDRDICHASGDIARMQGCATFTAHAEGLVYEERGQLSLNGAPPVEAQQRHLWAPDLSVRFGDGRAFHTVPAAGGSARHWCDPDSYVVTYDFADWPRWKTVWRVMGPRKDYTMVTRYRPQP